MTTRLPEEPSDHTVTPRQWLGTLCVAAVVLITVNLACKGLTKAYPVNTGFTLIDTKWRLLRTLDQPVDWLVLGDSSGDQGVDPRLIQDIAGERSVNLCTIGNCLLVDDAWMLDEYLQRFPPPKRVVLIHVYDVWNRERIPTSLLAAFPMKHGFWSKRTPSFTLTPKQQASVFARRAAPMAFQNTSITAFLLGRWTRPPATPHTTRGDGFSPRTNQSDKRVISDVASHRYRLKSKTFKMSSLNEAALQRLLETTQRAGIELVIANSPISKLLAEEASYQAFRQEMDTWFTATLAPYPHARHLYFDEPMAFETHLMRNADHTTLAAAQTYTRALVDDGRETRAPGHQTP